MQGSGEGGGGWTRLEARPLLCCSRKHTLGILVARSRIRCRGYNSAYGAKGKALGPDSLGFHPSSVPEQLGKHGEVTSCF